MKGRHYLLWLDWPESAFRLNARSLAAFKTRARGAAVTAVKSERAFLRYLPAATHAVVWNFDKAWFARAPRLSVLATPGAGRELMPRDDELPRGVAKIHGAFHGPIMAETVAACVLAHARGLYVCHDFQCAGTPLWPRAALSPHCFRVAGTRAVLLGYGNVGRAIGAKLEALGVSVTGIRRRNIDELVPACRTADWLIAALPSDTGTDDLVNATVLRALPRRAVFVNVGRGNSVDEVALVRALKARRLAAAFLDVFKREPLDAASPLAADVPGLHRLPHGSAFAPDYLESFWAELAERGFFGK